MPTDPLTREEAKRLVEMAGEIGTPWTAPRDEAAYAVLYRCGVRSEEATRLELSDIRETDRGWSLRVRYPKGRKRSRNPAKPREVGLDDGTRRILDRWLEIRGRGPGPLFCTESGGRLLTSHWRRKIKSVARGAKIEKRVHCHGLRHTYARMLHDEGVSVALISRALGHRNLATTAEYLGSLGSPEVVEATAGREW